MKRHKKRGAVVIAGYYGFGNAGDELILSTLVSRLQKEQPGRSLTVFTPRPERTAEDHGVKAVNRWKPWTWVRPLWEAECFILGGGGLLQESTGPWNHAYYLFLVFLAKCLGCRTEVRAIGVDPVGRGGNRIWTRWVFNLLVDYASVRDADSQRALEMIGVRTRLWKTPDPVFMLGRIRPPAVPRNPPRIAWALSSWPQRPGWDHDVSFLMQRAARELGVANDLLVFFPEEDLEIARKISAATAPPAPVRTWERTDDLLTWIQDADMVIGMRYHALILAALAEKPFIGLGYQQKIRTLCRDFNQPMWTFERGWEAESVYRLVSDSWKRRQTLPDRYRKQIAHLIHSPAEANETARIFVALA